MVCQRKFILKTIIDVNLGYIPGSICTILSIAYGNNGEIIGINVLFDGANDSIPIPPINSTQHLCSFNYYSIEDKKFPLLRITPTNFRHHMQINNQEQFI